MTEAASPAEFDFGRVLKRTFTVIGRNLPVFLTLAVILYGVPQFWLTWFQSNLMTVGDPRSLTLFVGLLVLTFVGASVLQAALIHGTVSDLNGKRAGLGACLGTGLKFFLPIVALTVLSGLGVALGLVLLIVPGIMLAMAWSVVVPAEVMERTGVFGAFRRSLELTRGHRWSILGIYLVYGVISWVVVGGLAATGMMSLSGAPNPSVVAGVVAAVLQSVSTLIGSTAVGSIYYELRTIKEGVGPEQLAAVFD